MKITIKEQFFKILDSVKKDNFFIVEPEVGYILAYSPNDGCDTEAVEKEKEYLWKDYEKLVLSDKKDIEVSYNKSNITITIPYDVSINMIEAIDDTKVIVTDKLKFGKYLSKLFKEGFLLGNSDIEKLLEEKLKTMIEERPDFLRYYTV